jgi:hypothetical protein
MNVAKYLLPGALIAFGTLQAAAAGELPTYEITSFPATQHQLAVVGASAANEQTPVATLTRADMPASPVQLSVLSPHRRTASADAATTVGAARN